MNKLTTAAALLILASVAVTAVADEPADKKSKKGKSQEELYKAFEAKMKDVKLRGHFTTVKDGTIESKEESYTIRSAKKLDTKGDIWLITAHLSYGGQEGDVTLPLPVKWAGDTPVITLDSYKVPGMGTFSARVAFHGDRYFGTWQHDAKGGHIYGVLEKAEEK